jgi:hypothetical protein
VLKNEIVSKTALDFIPVRAKVTARAALTGMRQRIARMVQRMPGSWRVLGLPRRRVRYIEEWVGNARRSLDWIDRCKGPSYQRLSSLEVVARRPPRTVLNGPIHQAFTLERYHVHNETFLARIPNGRVLGPSGVVIGPGGEIFEESTWPSTWLENDRALASLKLPEVEKLQGSFYTIASLYSEGYWHWMLEALPRLFAIQSLQIDDLRLIVTGSLNRWQKESLDLMGFGSLVVIPLENRYLELEFLYFPSYVGTPGNPQKHVSEWMRDRFLGGSSLKRRDRRLYITRRAAGRRRLVNESEFEPILREYGFEIVEAAHLSLKAQVELFSEAEAVAGPHGAGLTNILFSPSGCKILELFNPKYVMANYYAEADMLGHEYWYLVGDSAGPCDIQHRNPCHDDLIVQATLLRETMKAMFSS